jgi:hypothetical protein
VLHYSAEVSGLQWLNTLLQAAWPAALEVLISNISAERLQEALDKVREQAVRVKHTAARCHSRQTLTDSRRLIPQSMQRRRVKFLESAYVHEFTLGCARSLLSKTTTLL